MATEARPAMEPDHRLRRLALTVATTARIGTGLDVAFLARMVDGEQEIRAVSVAEAARERMALLDLRCTTALFNVALGTATGVVVADTTTEAMLASARPASRGGIGAYAAVPLTLPDGTQYGALCAAGLDARPALGANTLDMLGVVGASVTDSVWTFAQRAGLEEARTALLAGAAHDLRTPLAAVRMIVEDLAEQMITPTQANALLRECTSEINGLVDVVLGAAAAPAPDASVHSEPCDLVALAGHVVAAAEATGGRSRVHLTAPEHLVARVDREHLRRALQNLVDNACKYSPSDEPVHVRLRSDTARGSVLLEVSDKGAGIPEQQLERLTERFFRAPAALSSDVPGHGLGLAVVKLAADLHGGRLEVSSQEGRGSCFALVLPLVQ